MRLHICYSLFLSLVICILFTAIFQTSVLASSSSDSSTSSEVPSFTFVLKGGIWGAKWVKPADTKIANTGATFIDYKIDPSTLGHAELFFSAKNTSLQLKLVKSKFEEAFDFGTGLSSDFIDNPKGINLLSVALNIGLGEKKGIIGMYADFGNFRGSANPSRDYRYHNSVFQKDDDLYWRTKFNAISAIFFFADGWKELVEGEPVLGIGPRRVSYKVPLAIESNKPMATTTEDDDIFDADLTALLVEARVIRSVGISEKKGITVAGAVGFGTLTADVSGLPQLKGKPAFQVDFEVGYQWPFLRKDKFRMNGILGLRFLYNSLSIDQYKSNEVEYSLHTTDTFFGLFGELAFGAILE